MAVAVDVGQNGRVGVPIFALCYDLDGRERRRGKAGRVIVQENDRRAAPVIHHEVHAPVFVDVGRQAAHRRDGAWIVALRRRRQGEGGKAMAGAGRRQHRDAVVARIDETNVGRVACIGYVGQRYAGADRRNPGVEAPRRWIDLAMVAHRPSTVGRLQIGCSEAKRGGEVPALFRRKVARQRQLIQHRDDSEGHDLGGVAKQQAFHDHPSVGKDSAAAMLCRHNW